MNTGGVVRIQPTPLAAHEADAAPILQGPAGASRRLSPRRSVITDRAAPAIRFLDKYKLTDPGLRALAEIMRGADTDARPLTPESAGLYAVATRFQAIAKNDHDSMAR